MINKQLNDVLTVANYSGRLIYTKCSIYVVDAPGVVGLQTVNLGATIITAYVPIDMWNHFCVRVNSTTVDMTVNGVSHETSLNRVKQEGKAKSSIKYTDGMNEGEQAFRVSSGLKNMTWSSRVWKASSLDISIEAIIDRLKSLPKAFLDRIAKYRAEEPSTSTLLMLGSFNDEKNYFSGLFSEFKFYSEYIGINTIKKMAQCSFNLPKGITLHAFYSSAKVKLSNLPQQSYCMSPSSHRVVVDKVSLLQQEANEFCQLQGGTLPILNDFHDVHLFNDSNFFNQNDGFSFWISNETNLENILTEKRFMPYRIPFPQ